VRAVRAVRWLGAAGAAVLLAGCGASSGPAAELSPSPQVSVSASHPPADHDVARSKWSSCAAKLGNSLNPGPGLGRATALPSGFRAAAVVRCVTADRTNRDGSQDMVLDERRTSAPAAVARLVLALGLPDSPPSQLPCAAALLVLPPMAVLDPAGRWISPALPAGPCGGPRAEVQAAIHALPEATTETSTVRRVLSSSAAAAGCSQSWSDVIHLNSTLPGARRPLTPNGDPLPATDPIRVCEYEVDATEFGQQKPGGDFMAGRVVTGADRRRLGELLAEASPARACRAEATHFAVLMTPARTDPVVYVELDACRRLLVDAVGTGGREDSRLGQAPAALLDALHVH